MDFFSDCVGKCENCENYYLGNNCLAGHGDNYFKELTLETAKYYLLEYKNGKIKNDK